MMDIQFPELWDDQITAELDGTFSVMVPAIDDYLRGIPTKQLAREICYALSKSTDWGASLAMTDQ